MDDLDKQTRDLIKNRIDSQNSLTGNWEQDQGKAGGYEAPAQLPFDFGQKAYGNAIQEKANARFYDPQVAKTEALSKYNYAGQTQGRMKAVQQQALGQQRYDNARQLAAHQRVAQEESQRAALLQGILGIAGTGAGYALAGPVGGAVGGKIGSLSQSPAVNPGLTGDSAQEGDMRAYEGV